MRASARFNRALVVGKFIPPHLGHSALIEHASAAAEAVTVVVCDRSGQLPTAGQRASWLQAEHPTADVVIVADICPHPSTSPCPPECSPAWAAQLAQLGLTTDVDCVVSSEGYGPLLATALGATHQPFDPDRATVTVSGTQVRTDLAASWALLPQATRVGLHRRVVVLGAEIPQRLETEPAKLLGKTLSVNGQPFEVIGVFGQIGHDAGIFATSQDGEICKGLVGEWLDMVEDGSSDAVSFALSFTVA